MERYNRSRLVFFLVSVAVVVPVLSATLVGAADETSSGDSFYKYLSVFTEVLKLVRQVYVEEPDIQNLMAGALSGATDALDPFSVYVPAREVEAYRRTQEVWRDRCGMLVLKERGVAYVVAVDEGGAAQAAGIERGDILSKLNGQSSRVMPLWALRRIFAGDPGTEINLEIVRQAESENRVLTLGATVAGKVRLSEDEGVGILRIPALTAATPAQLEQTIASYDGERLLIDLRGVAGGEAERAYEVASQMAAVGELGRLVHRDETEKSFSSSADESLYSGELAVLMDHGTQGAAEILAQILKQSRQAVLFGEPSFGHAGDTQLIRLSSGGFLEATASFYTGPDGEPLLKSLEPDHLVALPFGASSFSSSSADEPGDEAAEDVPEDPVLERALELWLEEPEEPVTEREVA